MFLMFFPLWTDRLGGYNRGAHIVRGYILGGYGPRATLTSLRSRFSYVFLALWNQSSGSLQCGSLQLEWLHSGWLRSQGNPDQFAVLFFLPFSFFGTDHLGGYRVGAYNVRGHVLGDYGLRAALTSSRSQFSRVVPSVEPIIWVATLWGPTM